MIKNYFYTALRNIIRHKVFSFIVILGLTIGVAIFGLVSLYVKNELSFDRFNENFRSVYRLEYSDWALTGTAYGPEIARQFPEIRSFCRVSCWEGSGVTIRKGDELMKLENLVYADSGFFNLFSFRFISGNPHRAVSVPNGIVLTESTARRIFGDENPMNQSFTVNNKVMFTVTGIIRDASRFHLKVNAIAPFVSLSEFYNTPGFLEQYDSWNYYTYFNLSEKGNAPALADKINNYFTGKANWSDSRPEFSLRPLSEIYYTPVKNDFPMTKANRSMLNLYLMIALFILFIACINFINLTVARSTTRSREIGLRKVMGASRLNLVIQFLGESVIYALIATELSLVLMELLRPGFNNLVQRQLGMSFINPGWFIVLLLVVPVLIGLLAGIYPALYLTRFRPVITLRNEKTRGKGSLFFRRLLIVSQFTISIVLIIATFTVHKQLIYLRKADLGFSRDYVINVALNSALQKHLPAFREMLLQEPLISDISFTTQSLENVSWQESIEVNADNKQFTFLGIDDRFIPLLKMKMLEGRNFQPGTPSDSARVIINQEAVGYFGLKGPAVGQVIGTGERRLEVLGVVNNFHFNSLRSPIGPLVMMLQRNYLTTANIKTGAQDIPAVINHLRKVWNTMCPDFLFEYRFLDKSYEQLYHDEERLGKLFLYLALLAIFIASMGLLGLSSFLAEQKTKEIGVRKAMGDSTAGIVKRFGMEFGKWVIVSGFIAVPLAWWLMTRWLGGFAYKVSMDGWITAGSCLIALITAFGTVVGQTWKIAAKNPAEALRYE